MPPDSREDLELAAENRRRRRLGLMPGWPLPLEELQFALFKLALENSDLVQQRTVVTMAGLGFVAAPTHGAQKGLLDRAGELLAEARYAIAAGRGTREPGEDG